jgi:C_GCAxxG_C_C family probable redox protein
MCGALSGAIMGISLVKGRTSPEESIEPSYADIQALLKEFEEKFGTVTCQGLLKVDISKEEGRDAYGEKNLHAQCGEYVAEAVRIAVGLLNA